MDVARQAGRGDAPHSPSLTGAGDMKHAPFRQHSSDVCWWFTDLGPTSRVNSVRSESKFDSRLSPEFRRRSHHDVSTSVFTESQGVSRHRVTVSPLVRYSSAHIPSSKFIASHVVNVSHRPLSTGNCSSPRYHLPLPSCCWGGRFVMFCHQNTGWATKLRQPMQRNACGYSREVWKCYTAFSVGLLTPMAAPSRNNVFGVHSIRDRCL